MNIELINMIQLFISSLVHEFLCNIVKHREFEVQAFAIDVLVNHEYAQDLKGSRVLAYVVMSAE